MREISLNVLDAEDILRLKAVLNEVVLALPKQHRSNEMLACVAEQLLMLAAAGEKDPIELRKRAMLTLQVIWRHCSWSRAGARK
jgi:hypothetical protein